MKNLLRAFVLLLLAASMTAGVVAHAQAPTSKRIVKIDDQTGELVDVTEAQEASKAASAPGIVILNNQKSTQGVSQGSSQRQNAIQDQQTSVIEDSPLNMSAAERRRRDRQGLELQTEQKIVEKLEDARMEDERSRSERLFNKGFSSRDQHQEVQVIQTHAPAPAPAPAVVVIEQKPEVRTTVVEVMPKHQDPRSSFYMSGLVGVGEYNDAINVQGGMALGFGIGMVTKENMVVEGTFQYSNYDVAKSAYTSYQAGNYSNSIPFTKVSQYNFQAVGKYQPFTGTFRPHVGAIAGYTYRSYEGQNYYGQPQNQYQGYGSSASSHAFDIGALVGVDVQLTNSFSIGGDFRYLMNIAYRGNNDYSTAYNVLPAPYKRLEEFSYYIWSVNSKFTF